VYLFKQNGRKKARGGREKGRSSSQREADPKKAWPAVARVLINLDEFITRE
jgi:hypothetical protein